MKLKDIIIKLVNNSQVTLEEVVFVINQYLDTFEDMTDEQKSSNIKKCMSDPNRMQIAIEQSVEYFVNQGVICITRLFDKHGNHIKLLSID